MENKKEWNINEDLPVMKGAIGELPKTPEGIPPGLEDAPSPTPEQVTPQREEKKQLFHQKPKEQPIENIIKPETLPKAPPERSSFEVIEEIAESVISEKWEDLIKGMGDLKLWKEKVDTDLAGIKQEIVRIQSRFEGLQNSVLGKVSEYSEGMSNVSIEIKALEKVLEKIINPLSKNVRDLEKVTKQLKSK